MKLENSFEIQACIARALPGELSVLPGIVTSRVRATVPPDNPEVFFQYIPKPEEYNKYTTGACRLEVKLIGRTPVVYYLFFRNGREGRPDLGPGRYDWTRPSSIELGRVRNDAFVSLKKVHYTDINATSITELGNALARLIGQTIRGDLR